MAFSKTQNNPIKRVHKNGNSAVIAIAPIHIQCLGIDDTTFFEEKAVPNGILLEMKKFSTTDEESDSK
jgi:hypothetical protein